jgi:para-aminobenzoate synthetase/4-amino-4-deoxychorismate lyase
MTQQMGKSPAPDPSLGVFETMLAVGGEPVELAAHLDRLRASLERLYAARLPADAGASVLAGVRGLDLGRVRLSASPCDAEIDFDVAAVEIDAAIVFPPWERGLELRTQAVDGWRGEHKWADRRLLDGLDKETAPAGALLVDADGCVLETTRANLFVVRSDGRLATPPTDGRILPGVARMRAIEIARAAGLEPVEEPVTAADLASAHEAFTTGSVRGVELVRSIDGVEIRQQEPPVAAAVAADMRQRWLGERQPAPQTAI